MAAVDLLEATPERPPAQRHGFARRRPALPGRLRGLPARAHRVCPRRSAPESGVATIPRPGGRLAFRLRHRTSVPSSGRCSDPGTRGGIGGPGRGPDPVGGRLRGRRLLRPGGVRRDGLRLPGCGPRAGIVPGVCEAAHQSDQLRACSTTMRPVTAASQRIAWPGRSWGMDRPRRSVKRHPSSFVSGTPLAGIC